MSNCKNKDSFCVVCGCYILSQNRKRCTENVKNNYEKCFGISKETFENNWTPQVICSLCHVHISKSASRNINATPFSTPMEWRNPGDNHITDCYFCSCNTSGYNSKNIGSITYLKVSSVTFPIPIQRNEMNPNDLSEAHTSQSPNPEIESLNHDQNHEEMQTGDANIEESNAVKPEIVLVEKPLEKETFDQSELSDLCRDLGLSKENSELLASRLKEKSCLTPGTKVSFYRDRDVPFRKYFSREKELVYCNDVEGLIHEFESIEYKADEWRLFLDSSTRSLKAVLLHNGNKYAPIPIAHSTALKEEYENLQYILNELQYEKYKWLLCGDLKIITIMLGYQSGFTKYPCFLCEWDSRARNDHYSKKNWPVRNNLEVGSKNVIKQSLLPAERVLLPPLHIKLGLIKQLVKAMKKENTSAYQYLFDKFPKLSEAKISEGVFDGPQVRALFKDEHFEEIMTDTEREAWQSFREVSTSFLGNRKTPGYKEVVARMVTAFEKMGCLMNLKLHFLDSHIDYFPKNLGDFSEEQGERFHQDLKDVERRYQGVWDENMLADYCWGLKRDTKVAHKRKSIRRSFETKKTRYSSKKE